MRMQYRHRGWVWAMVLAIVTAPGIVLADGPKDEVALAGQAREQWIKGADQVLAGNFSGAVSTLEKLNRIDPAFAPAKSAIDWLKDTESLNASREKLRQENLDNLAKKAQGFAKDKKWSDALRYATLALEQAHDHDAFVAQEWVQKIIGHGLTEINKFKDKGEWREALILYNLLLEIEPKNKDYKAGLKLCRERAHFEFIYDKKGSWKTELSGVDSDAIRDILNRLDSDYVRNVDFKVLCRSGVENLQILADTKKLVDVFPELGDASRVDPFKARLNGLLERRVERNSDFDVRDLRSVFYQIMDINKETINLPENVVVNEFVSGLFEPLDEFTTVIWPSEVPEFNKHTRGEFVGVGIQITKEDQGYLRVESPLEDSPAYDAGIQPGDLITAVDGKSTAEMTITQAVNTITGQPNTKVTLTIQDPATQKAHDITLKRQQITIRTVFGDHRDNDKPTKWDYTIDKEHGICYVRVSSFMEKTVDDLEAALKQMRSEGCKGLILDLRFNPGGLLTSALGMCGLFLEEGAEITKTRGRNGSEEMQFEAKPSRHGRNFADLPIIVLVNEYSASASEIVAGALAGLKEACVIGDRSFGKGSVQRLIPIDGNRAYLKLTTDRYYVPDRDSSDGWYCLNKEENADVWGVEPHIKVDVIPQEIRKILRLRRKTDVLKGRDQAELPPEILDRRPSTTTQEAPIEAEDEFPDVDPQIAVALNVMRMKLISHQPWALAPRLQRALTHADTAANRTVEQQ